MENLPFGRIAALVPEFAVKDLPLGRTLMIMIFNLIIFEFLMMNLTQTVHFVK